MFMIELAVLNIQLSCVIFITVSSVIGITWLIVGGGGGKFSLGIRIFN